MLKWLGERLQGLNPAERIIGRRGAGEIVYPWDEHTNWLSNTNGQP